MIADFGDNDGMPEGRESPFIAADEILFTMVLAHDGWVNSALHSEDMTVLPIIASKLRDMARQIDNLIEQQRIKN